MSMTRKGAVVEHTFGNPVEPEVNIMTEMVSGWGVLTLRTASDTGQGWITALLEDLESATHFFSMHQCESHHRRRSPPQHRPWMRGGTSIDQWPGQGWHYTMSGREERRTYTLVSRLLVANEDDVLQVGQVSIHSLKQHERVATRNKPKQICFSYLITVMKASAWRNSGNVFHQVSISYNTVRGSLEDAVTMT